MTRSLLIRLIRKDLYLGRWVIGGGLVAGVLSLGMMVTSAVGYYVGNISLLCVLIVLNLFLTFQFIITERKEKNHLFVLSLPISASQYTAAKIAASLIAFGVPWLVLMVGYLGVIMGSPIPDGVVPLGIAVCGYLFAYFCAVVAVALIAASPAWTTTTIIIGNISVNFLIAYLMSRSSIMATLGGPVAVWTPDVVLIIAVELLGGLLVLGFALVMGRQGRAIFA